MKNRDDKQKDLEALRKDLEQAKNLFITGYEKLKVSQDFELRKVVRGAGGHYKVIKNNIAAKASEGTPAEAVLSDLKGIQELVTCLRVVEDPRSFVPSPRASLSYRHHEAIRSESIRPRR